MKIIKNIVFDIGNVILDGSPKEALKRFNITQEEKSLLEKEIYNDKLTELDLGYTTLKDYYNSVEINIPSYLRTIAKEVTTNSYKYRNINKDILNLIKKLQKKYNIYILSDNNMETYYYLRETELKEYITGWCISAMYHETKKNKNLYSIFFKEYNVTPEESVFIDDKEINIINAKKLGMNGIVLNNGNINELETELNKYLL